MRGRLRTACAAAWLAFGLSACKREAVPDSKPPVAMAGTARPDPAPVTLPETSPLSEAEPAPLPAFVRLDDTIPPLPEAETEVVAQDFYDSLAAALDSAEPEARAGSQAGPDSVPETILKARSHHGAEVPADADRHEWLAAYVDSGKCRIAPTRLRIQIERDDIVDGDEGDATGKDVQPLVPGKTEFLARDIEGFAPGPCSILAEDLTFFPAGRRFAFRYGGVDYVLAATYRKSTRIRDPHGYGVGVLRLFLTRKDPGGDSTVCLFRLAAMGSGVSIFRLGDFDGDGLPDLLVDDTGGHNQETTSLYLSRPAAPGRMLRRVASYTITGC